MACLLVLGWLASASTPAEAFGFSEPPPLPSVHAGGYTTCALQVDGTAACWGENGVPKNDIPNVQPGGAATPPPGVRFKELSSGYAVSCGITTDDAVVCFGSTRGGKLDEPTGTFTHVAPGLNYVCALRTDGTLACWGGEDPTVDALVLNNVPTGTFTQVTMGNRHACALRADGSIACWGVNADGQTTVPAGTYKYVNVSNFTSCALKTDDTPVCWGRNQGGQRTYPSGTFTKISTGFAHVCGLRADQTATCWGRNTEGQSTVPPGTYTDVSAGTFHSCGMRTTGPPATCWGNNATWKMQPSLATIPPPAAFITSPYSFQLTMASYVSPAPTYTMLSGALPAGVTLSPSGLLSGTPSESGSFTFSVNAISNGLSPPDCTVAGGGDNSCAPGVPTSRATATRSFSLVVNDYALVPGAIGGVVTDTRSGVPVVGALVRVAYPSGAPAGSATTDASGAYLVEGLAPGPFNVSTSPPELEPATKQATVVAEQTATLNFDLGPLIRPTVVSVSNNTFQTVTDGLFIKWSEPILSPLADDANYTVHTLAGCAGAAVATGLNGNWSPALPNVRDLEMTGWENVVYGGTYYLRVAPNTETADSDGLRNELACVQFVAALAPADQAAIIGNVTNSQGAPIAGATVTVTRFVRNPGTIAAQATSNAAGAFSASGFNWGTFDIVVSAPGFRPVTRRILLPAAKTTTADFTLLAVPAAQDDAYTHFGSDTALIVQAPGVLGNDSDVDLDPLTAAIVTGPTRGVFSFAPDGSFSYLPQEDFVGTDTFTYQVSDGSGTSNTATVTITVGAGCSGRAATITGTSGDDRLKGTDGADVIAGLGGADHVTTAGGNDVVCGGSGDDKLNGEAGADSINGGSGDDDVTGDVGDDTLVGSSGADKLIGGDGDDVLSGGTGSPDSCLGGAGVNTLAPDHGCEKANGFG